MAGNIDVNRTGRRRDRRGSLKKMIVQRDGKGLRNHFHLPLSDPAWLARDGYGQMQAQDAVLGLVVADQAFALPWWVMKNHHVANLQFGDTPVMVVLCEACAGASAFVARARGRRLQFCVEGKYNGTHILIDMQSRSLWTPFNGAAIKGPLKGTSLTRLPLLQCNWSEWRDLHPETLVPDGSNESRTGHGAIFPHPLVKRPVAFAKPTLLHHDDRLPGQELVLGVEAGGQAKAYSVDGVLGAGVVLNDRVGDREIVIFSLPESWLAVAFEREVGDRTLHFEPSAERRYFEDRETGSRWDARGRAVSGALAGHELSYVTFGVEKWFAWSAAHPGAEIYAPAAA